MAASAAQSAANNGNYSGLFNQVLGKALNLYNSPISAGKAVLNPNAVVAPLQGSYIDPTQVGQDAGLGYQAQIDQLGKNYNTTTNQNAQNLADIQSWYNQVTGTANNAAKADAAGLAQALSGDQSAAQGLLSAIGNGANNGAGGIANASAIANAALQGEGLAQQQYSNNEGTILQQNAADQLRNEQTLGTNRLQNLMDQIAQAKGDQSAAEAQAKDSAQQTLFDQKGSAANLLANLQGNLFNEKMGLRQEKLSELGGLSNTILGTALAGPQIQGANLNNKLLQGNITARNLSNKGLAAQIKAYTSQSSGGGEWSKAPLAVTNGIRSQLLQSGGEYLKPNGQLKIPPTAVKASLLRYFRENNFKVDGSLQTEINLLAKSILTPQRIKAWNNAHGTTFGAGTAYKPGVLQDMINQLKNP